jgi:hypothetical protein
MAVYFFLGVGMTTLLFTGLPGPYRPGVWGGTYSEVLPYVRDSFQNALECYKQNIPIELQKDLVQIVTQLCEPDPNRRGHPKDLKSPDQFSMQRYVSRFDLLAKHAELGVLHLLKK